MSVKAMAAFVASESDHGVNVSAFCVSAGVSRKTFYKWVARATAEGLAGLEDRSRRPLTSLGATPGDVEDEIVRLRKDLADVGSDHGAMSIQSRLAEDQRFAKRVPSVATIHRILVRRGQITLKRPGFSGGLVLPGSDGLGSGSDGSRCSRTRSVGRSRVRCGGGSR